MTQQYDIEIHSPKGKRFFKTMTFEGATQEEYRGKLKEYMAQELPTIPSVNNKVEGKEYWTAHGNFCNI